MLSEYFSTFILKLNKNNNKNCNRCNVPWHTKNTHKKKNYIQLNPVIANPGYSDTSMKNHRPGPIRTSRYTLQA